MSLKALPVKNTAVKKQIGGTMFSPPPPPKADRFNVLLLLSRQSYELIINISGDLISI